MRSTSVGRGGVLRNGDDLGQVGEGGAVRMLACKSERFLIGSPARCLEW